MSEIECQLCRKHFKTGQAMKANLLEEPIVQMIREKYPEWSSEGYICLPDLYLFRARYVTEILKTSSQEIYDLGKEMDKEEQATPRNINKEFDSSLTLGERFADALAKFGGSWTFISIFIAMIVIWMGINSFVLIETAFRSLSVYPAQPGAILSRRFSGAGDHDEPEPPGGQGPPPG